MGDPARDLERVAIIFPCTGHHEEVDPVEEDNPRHLWSDAVPHQDIHATLLVQGVIGFLDIK